MDERKESRETWLVKLWLQNTEADYFYWRDQAKEAIQTEGKAGAAAELARRLQEETEEGAPIQGAGMYADLLTAAMQRVDWYDVAESFTEEFEEAEKKEGEE